MFYEFRVFLMYATFSTRLCFDRHVLKDRNNEDLHDSILSSLLPPLLDVQMFSSAPRPQMPSVIFFLSVRSQVSYSYKSVGKIIDFSILPSIGKESKLTRINALSVCMCLPLCSSISVFQSVNRNLV
jgi:hypothetical protein